MIQLLRRVNFKGSRLFTTSNSSPARFISPTMNNLNGKTQEYDYETKLYTHITKASTTPIKTDNPDKRKQKAFDRVIDALKALGFDLETSSFPSKGLSLPPIIHVAGTKGKGSVCSFTESILRQQGYKTGLFTSPHLVKVNERVKLNGKPISDEKMQFYVDIVMTTLEQQNKLENLGFFRLMTVIGIYIFCHEKLDVIILEVGLGGLLDATNVLKKKSITAVTLLDFDHTEFLGNTIEEIAAQKAGIFIKNTPCLTISSQSLNALKVLEQTATNFGNKLEVVDSQIVLSKYSEPFQLGLNGSHQYENAALAIKICEYFEGKSLPINVLKTGLKETKYYGRCQILKQQTMTFYVDGAHTSKSMEATVKWLETISQNNLILVFNCAHTKDIISLLTTLIKSKLSFKKVYFVEPLSKKPSSTPYPNLKDLIQQTEVETLTWQQKQAKVWEHLYKGKLEISSELKINEALSVIKDQHPNSHVLVTGSLLLVGDALKALKFNFNS